MTIEEMRKLAAEDHIVNNFLAMKEIFGIDYKIGILESPGKSVKYSTFTELYKAGHIAEKFCVLDQYLRNINPIPTGIAELTKEKHGEIKFVGLSTGEYRFCNLETEHRSLVNPEDIVTSAGFIVYGKFKEIIQFKVIDRKSCSLMIGPSLQDGYNIAKINDWNYLGIKKCF